MADPITGDFGDVGIRRILSALFLRGVTARAAPGATVSRAAAGFGTVPRLGWMADTKGFVSGIPGKIEEKKKKEKGKKKSYLQKDEERACEDKAAL